VTVPAGSLSFRSASIADSELAVIGLVRHLLLDHAVRDHLTRIVRVLIDEALEAAHQVEVRAGVRWETAGAARVHPAEVAGFFMRPWYRGDTEAASSSSRYIDPRGQVLTGQPHMSERPEKLSQLYEQSMRAFLAAGKAAELKPTPGTPQWKRWSDLCAEAIAASTEYTKELERTRSPPK
jgi:hypothetical protein